MSDGFKLDIWSQIETIQPARKVVIAGASNVSRAFPVLISSLLHAFDEPLSIYVAKGHGRSYGIETSFFKKKNLGIFQSNLFQEIARENSVPIHACLTDIGNDLAYEQPVENILGWVETSIDYLLRCDSKIVLTELPINILREMSEARFKLLRTLFFPFCRLDHGEIMKRAERLNDCLNKIAKSRKIPVFAVPNEMYSWDPIHPRRRDLQAIWRELLRIMTGMEIDWKDYRKSRFLCWYLRALQSKTHPINPSQPKTKRPNGLLSNGTKIFLY